MPKLNDEDKVYMRRIATEFAVKLADINGATEATAEKVVADAKVISDFIIGDN